MTAADVRTFYDARVERQLRDFIDGNARVERAWSTLERFAPPAPRRILEIGCGIGAVSWRMVHDWPQAEVFALDVSPEQLRVGETLFASPRLHFVEGPLTTAVVEGPFDLVVLLDVYEHIAVDDRAALHSALAELIADAGRVVVSTPTPRHLRWLRPNHPDEIQPIDENITVEVLLGLASDTGTELCFYEEVSVWHQGDYLHAVLRRQAGWTLGSREAVKRGRAARLLAGLRRLMRLDPAHRAKAERADLVREKLGNRFTG